MTGQDIPGAKRPTIFIVDDDVCAQQLLGDTLAAGGYAIRSLLAGAGALREAVKELPDLILLDVMMPDMDGFEVCRLLKEEQATRFIPVVMVTSINDKAMRLKGIAVGADDFISKPIDTTEILLRVRNLVLVKQYHDFIKQHSDILEQQIRLRTDELEQVIAELKNTHLQLVQQEKMATIGQLTAGIAHEINNPISFIASNIAMFDKYCERILRFIEAQSETLPDGRPGGQRGEQVQTLRRQMKIDRIVRDIPEMIRETMEGIERIKSIVRDLKCFSRIEASEKQLADINQCLESTLNIAGNELKYKATVRRKLGELPPLLCYPQQLGQIFMNLLVNAAHAIEEKGEITVQSWQEDGQIHVAVSDTGSGIAEQHLSRIFDPFFTTKEVGRGTGLGLSISSELVRNHGGTIRVDSRVGQGSTFTVSLPFRRQGGV